MWKFRQKLNFVSTPWKIKIPLGNSVGALYGSYKSICVDNDFFFYTKVTIFENLMKKLIAAGVLRINTWFSIHVPKIKFDPTPQQQNAKKYNFFQMLKFRQKT